MATEVVKVVKLDEAGEEFRYVGKTLTKIDAAEKVTGKAVYGVDFSFAPMLLGKMKRSEVPHTEIVRIDSNTRKDCQAPDERIGILLRQLALPDG